MSIISYTDVRDAIGAAADDTLLPVLHPYVERLAERYVGWELEQATYTRFFPRAEKGGADSYFPGDFGMGSVGGYTSVLYLDHKYVIPTGLIVHENSGAYMGQVGDFDDDVLLTLGTHYVLDLSDANVSRSGSLIRLSSSWPKKVGSVQVKYTAGFTAAELAGTGGNHDASDIRMAIILMLQKAFNEIATHQKDTVAGTTGAIVSESIPGYSYTLDGGIAKSLYGMTHEMPPEAAVILNRYRRYHLVV